MIVCPYCGHINTEGFATCVRCLINLEWAVHNMAPFDPGGKDSAGGPVETGSEIDNRSTPEAGRGFWSRDDVELGSLFGLVAFLASMASSPAFDQALSGEAAWDELFLRVPASIAAGGVGGAVGGFASKLMGRGPWEKAVVRAIYGAEGGILASAGISLLIPLVLILAYI